jgi:ABC-2 type transport system ATP-binding protein
MRKRSDVGRVDRERLAENPLVSIRNISKVYTPSGPLMRMLLRSSIREPVLALDDVSMDVFAGRITAIVGPNGAGKSTLFRILTGLTTPTSGEASICGLDAVRQSYAVRKVVGFAPADYRTLLLRHTCFENLVFHGQLQAIPSRELGPRVGETLELVGLGKVKNRVVDALSSGMKARLQLARAFLHRPRVLILDEPTGAIDPIAAYELLGIIQNMVAEHGSAALISSHRLEEIEALHDDVVLLDQGRIVHRGDLDSLRREWEEPRVEMQFDSPETCQAAAESLVSVDGVQITKRNDTLLTLSTSVGLGRLFTLANGHLDKVVAVRETKMPLRDLLAKMLQPSKEDR